MPRAVSVFCNALSRIFFCLLLHFAPPSCPLVLPHIFLPAVPRASSRLLEPPFTCDLPDPLSPTANISLSALSPLSPIPSFPLVILHSTAAQRLSYRHPCSSQQQSASEVLASLLTALSTASLFFPINDTSTCQQCYGIFFITVPSCNTSHILRRR
jgi:hypothetical protein